MYKAIYPTLLLAVLGLWLWWHQGQENYLPKPPGYPRIELPTHTYAPLQGAFPYQFEISQHATVVLGNATKVEKYWIDIYYPIFDATIKLTYKPVRNNPQLLHEYCADAYKLTAKHQVKASSIKETTFKTSQGYVALLTDLQGEVPSQVQFYTTDMAHHFLRGALYFNTATQNDYLAPVITFIRQDIIHLIQTLEWRKNFNG